MATKKQQNSATSGTKTEQYVGLEGDSNARVENKVRYPLSDSAKELLTKLAEYFDTSIPKLESWFSEFTPEDQNEIVSWARELAYEPTISQLLVPKNEHEEKMFEMFSSVANYIKEYEETKYYDQLYEEEI